ncbi:MAG: hypothetical protein ACLUMK_12575 [Christensenellales bacterium]
MDMMILINGFCLSAVGTVGRREKGRARGVYEKAAGARASVYLLTIAVMLGVALATRAYGGNRSFMLRDVASHLTYTQMFAYDTYYATNLGGSLWTLALVQLYLIFPLLARAFRRQPAATFAAMMGIALATRGYIAATYPDVTCISISFRRIWIRSRWAWRRRSRMCASRSEARRGDAPCVQRGDGCGALAARRTAKVQAGCATTGPFGWGR